MKMKQKFFGTTASQIIITAESHLEADAIESALQRTYGVKGCFVTALDKHGRKEFTIYPRAAKRQLVKLELSGLKELEAIVKAHVDDPIMKLKIGDKMVDYMPLETQI